MGENVFKRINGSGLDFYHSQAILLNVCIQPNFKMRITPVVLCLTKIDKKIASKFTKLSITLNNRKSKTQTRICCTKNILSKLNDD